MQAKVGQGTPAKAAAEALPKAWNSVPKVEVAPIPPRPPPVQRSKQQYTTRRNPPMAQVVEGSGEVTPPWRVVKNPKQPVNLSTLNKYELKDYITNVLGVDLKEINHGQKLTRICEAAHKCCQILRHGKYRGKPVRDRGMDEEAFMPMSRLLRQFAMDEANWSSRLDGAITNNSLHWSSRLDEPSAKAVCDGRSYHQQQISELQGVIQQLLSHIPVQQAPGLAWATHPPAQPRPRSQTPVIHIPDQEPAEDMVYIASDSEEPL